MWVFSSGVPGAKAANPYNEINQKAPLFPALVLPALKQAVWNPVLYQEDLMWRYEVLILLKNIIIYIY